jgi:hypothetical protein
MRLASILLVAPLLLVLGQPAQGFGTIRSLGQNAEHERITRHALACGQPEAPAACFQPYSLDQLAGKNGTFGAVGAPDNPARGLLSADYAHCDNADYLDIPGYPQSQAQAETNLTACRHWIQSNMTEAVIDSAALLKNGRIDNSQIPTVISCTFNGRKGRAKCNALEDFGLALHAAHDFYAHSNWSDVAGPGPAGIDNVPGLGNPGPAAWLDLKQIVPFPAGLLTGCFNMGLPPDPHGVRGCPNRATHFRLNKDTGQIDPVLGDGTTVRGRIDANFAHAVSAAIAETRDKWADFQAMLAARYGARDAALMVCALTRDNPVQDCD